MYCVPEKEISRAAYKDAYATLQQEHPEWEPHDLRVHTANDLLPKFLADQRTAIRENLGLPVNDVPEAAFTMTDTGSVWYPNYGSGVGLVQLSERSKKLMPDKYSPDEHATSLLIEAQFQDGATTVATSYGGRDIVIMEYDPKTNEGKTTVINTAVVQEAQNKTIQEFMQDFFPQLTSVFVTNKVFLFSDKELTVSRAKEIVRPILEDGITASKRIYEQSHQQAYMPLPFFPIEGTDQRDAFIHGVVPELRGEVTEVKQEEWQRIAFFEQHGIHTDRKEEKKTIGKEVTPEVAEQYAQPQEVVSEGTVVFQYENVEVIATKQKHIQIVSPSVVVESNEQKMNMVSHDVLVVGSVQQEAVKLQESYIGNWQSALNKQQMEVSEIIAELSQLQEKVEMERIDVVACQYEENGEDVVISETIEEYFKNSDTAEAVVEMQSQDVRKLYRVSTQEQPHVEEQEPKDVKRVKKLCWVVPLTITTEQPEMLEVEMPKDQNQRLYNLLHFLRKVIKQQFGEDTIHQRYTHAVQADRQETYIDEIEYYLSLLEQKNVRSHVFALVS